MAWTSVKETFGRRFRTGIRETSGVRVFQCTSSTRITDMSQATVADDGVTAIPEKGDSWPAGGENTAGLRVVAIEPEEIDKEQKIYLVTVEYATESSQDQFTPDPADRDWMVHWSVDWIEDIPYRTATDTTVAGITSSFPTGGSDFEIKGRSKDKPVVNRVKDKIPGIDRRAVFSCTLQKYYTSANFTAVLGGVAGLSAYLDTCNDAVITVAGLTNAGMYTLLMDSIDIENYFEAGYERISVTYKIIYDPYTHSQILLNAGFNAYATAGTAPKRRIVDPNGPASDPQPLNDDGTKCADTDKRIYYAFGLKKSTTWSTLGLPAAIPT